MFDINSLLSASIFFCCLSAGLCYATYSVRCIVELTTFPAPHCSLHDNSLGAAIRMIGVPGFTILVYAVTEASFVPPLLHANLLMSVLNIFLSIYILRLRAGEYRKWSFEDQSKYRVLRLYCIGYPLITVLFCIGFFICFNP